MNDIGSRCGGGVVVSPLIGSRQDCFSRKQRFSKSVDDRDREWKPGGCSFKRPPQAFEWTPPRMLCDRDEGLVCATKQWLKKETGICTIVANMWARRTLPSTLATTRTRIRDCGYNNGKRKRGDGEVQWCSTCMASMAVEGGGGWWCKQERGDATGIGVRQREHTGYSRLQQTMGRGLAGSTPALFS